MTAPHPSRRREAVLREMGLGPIWRLRARAVEASGAECVAGEVAEAAPMETGAIPCLARNEVRRMPFSPPPGAVRAPASATASRSNPAPQPGPRGAEPARTRAADVPPVPDPRSRGAATASEAPDAARVARIATLEWDALEAEIGDCKACALCERRKQAVPGVGDRQARWMLVGEAPGAEEDQRGEPFVGQAGRLLDNMLAAIGLKRGEDVYIANAVKCRPPHNRTPERGEIAACLPYLERQIALVQPRLLIALGRPAAQALLAREIAISAARGRAFEHAGIPVVVTYHPAYLLRNPQDKAKAWEDLCFARRLMADAG